MNAHTLQRYCQLAIVARLAYNVVRCSLIPCELKPKSRQSVTIIYISVILQRSRVYFQVNCVKLGSYYFQTQFSNFALTRHPLKVHYLCYQGAKEVSRFTELQQTVNNESSQMGNSFRTLQFPFNKGHDPFAHAQSTPIWKGNSEKDKPKFT